jgi:hypothetical protein
LGDRSGGNSTKGNTEKENPKGWLGRLFGG